LASCRVLAERGTTVATVAEPLPRYFSPIQRKIDDDRKFAKILLETGGMVPPEMATGATAGGDRDRLRGLPAIGRARLGDDEGH